MVGRVWAVLALFALLSGAMVMSVERAEAEEKAAASKADAILGEWWTEKNEGRVLIKRDKDGSFHGLTTCCQHNNDPNNPKTDINNPNPKQRGRSTTGIVIFWKLKYDPDDDEFTDGYVYNPRDGKTYRIEMKVLDAETLKIRGYMGISLLGQSQIWKRAHLKPGEGAAARP